MSIISKEVLTFLEVARWRSVRSAADRLNISASALSRQIRILEQDLGVKLFTRHANGVQISESGEQFLHGIQQMMALETNLRAEISATATTRQSLIRLGLAESISTEMARRLYAYLAQTGQNIRLQIVVGETDRLVKQLVGGDLDGVVAFNMLVDERFRVITVVEVPVGLVCARAAITNPPASIALADCLHWPLCLPGESLSIQPRLLAALHGQEKSYRIAATSNSLATTCGLIVDGAGVGFMTELDVQAQPEADKLCFIPLRDRRLTEMISFAVATNLGLRGQHGKTLLHIGALLADITAGKTGKPSPDQSGSLVASNPKVAGSSS